MAPRSDKERLKEAGKTTGDREQIGWFAKSEGVAKGCLVSKYFYLCEQDLCFFLVGNFASLFSVSPD